MVNKTSAEQFEKVGAQAAEIFGQFVNLAAGLSREFSSSQNSADARNGFSPESGRSDSKEDSTAEKDDTLREVGEKLRELRETSGYTLDRFASALESELHNGSVVRKVNAVEAGREALPGDWVQAFSALLGNNEIKQLFDGLSDSSDTASAASESLSALRAERLAAIFANDPALEALTGQEFEKLLAFVDGSYQQAKAMISD